MEKDVAVAKARKPANQAHMLAAEEEKETVKLEKPVNSVCVILCVTMFIYWLTTDG